jgi:hypothetical protein
MHFRILELFNKTAYIRIIYNDEKGIRYNPSIGFASKKVKLFENELDALK